MQSSIEVIKYLTTLDYTVFLLTILCTLGFILWGNSKKSGQDSEEDTFMDMLLMGRRLTLPLFVATLVATWYGGIFGVAQIAFENGIFNFVTQGFFWYVTYFIFAFFILKKIAPYEAVTLPDLVGKLFGPKSRTLVAVLNVFNLIPIAYTISIGLFINMLFGISFVPALIIGVGFVLSYSFFDGFRSVVYSDLFQFFIMVVAVMMVFGLSVGTFGTAPLLELPDSYFNPMGTFSLGETLAWGMIALSTLVDPNFYQRCFAASDFKVAKKGILISTAIWVVFDLGLTFGAMYAKATIPDADPSQGYFIYAIQLLPSGFRGLFLAGICATILSTLDSYIFLAGSTLAYDLVPKRLQGKVSMHHLGVLSVAILSIILACIFEGDIKNVWKTLGSISSSALLVPILSAHLLKTRLTDKQFLFSSLSGTIGTMYWRLSGLKYTYNLDEIYVGMSCAAIAIFLVKVKNTVKPA